MMTEIPRDRRREAIMDVAIEVLAERGYRDTTMLEVAKRASASKETLYAWFGSKRGLFEAVIRRNAETVQAMLARHLAADVSPDRPLMEFGRALLTLLSSDSAIAINRAAISEARSDPTLARTLAQFGRDATVPIFIAFLERQRALGFLRIDAADEAAEHFLGLLLGDIQIRRLLGTVAAPTEAEIEARAAGGARAFLQLYGPDAWLQEDPAGTG